MIKRMIIIALTATVVSQSAFAGEETLNPPSGRLFNVTTTDNNLTINTTKPGWFYQFAGIKLTTPGYSIYGNTLPSGNGFFLFPVSDTQPANFVISRPASGPTQDVNFNLCLNGIGQTYSCEKHSFLSVNYLEGTSCGSYDFVDIQANGFYVGNGDDDSFPVTLQAGHPINLYGTNYSVLNMSTNGIISSSDSDGWANTSLPTSDITGNTLFVLWNDLISGASPQGLYYQYFDSCPRTSMDIATEGCHVFQWRTGNYSEGGDFNLEAIIYDQSGTVVYQYGAGNLTEGSSATIGVQNTSGSKFVQIAYNTPGAVPDNSVRCLKHYKDSPQL